MHSSELKEDDGQPILCRQNALGGGVFFDSGGSWRLLRKYCPV